MEYLLKLIIISVLLNLSVLKLMHFKDMHLLLTIFTALQIYTVHRAIQQYRSI